MVKEISFFRAFLLFWKNYFKFTGRATRTEFWFAVIWLVILFLPITFLSMMIDILFVIGVLTLAMPLIFFGLSGMSIYGYAVSIFMIIILLPTLTMMIRRFHDTGRTMVIPILFVIWTIIKYTYPYWGGEYGETFEWLIILMIQYVYFVFSIYVIVLLSLPSQKGVNKYGRNFYMVDNENSQISNQNELEREFDALSVSSHQQQSVAQTENHNVQNSNEQSVSENVSDEQVIEKSEMNSEIKQNRGDDTMQEKQKKSVGFLEAFILFWKRYVDFKGRSRRSEFWFMVLWTMIIQIALNALDALLGLNQDFDNTSFGLTMVYEIASFIPWIALLSRRFHDTGNTMVVPIIFVAVLFIERMLLFVDLGESTLSLIIHAVLTIGEIVFTIYVIVVGVQKSQEGPNDYGPEPVGQRYSAV